MDAQTQRCWVGLHLPDLALEAFIATLGTAGEGRPVALLHAARVSAADALAHALGVQVGQRRATALALAPDLLLGSASAPRQARALLAVAHAALGFTPAVTIDGTDGVLLEVSATLRLFGGLARLGRRLHAALLPLGHRLCWACAPTPAGAALLARSLSCQRHAPDRGHDGQALLQAMSLPQLRARLQCLPLELLCPDVAPLERLQAMGLRTLGDLQGLPRDGLARRCGPALLAHIDRARGDVPDPREWLAPQEVFDERLEMFARADNSAQLMHAAARLLGRLLAWARARQGLVAAFTLLAHHEPCRGDRGSGRDGSALQIALAQPSVDVAHLDALLRERLTRWALPAPALEVSLRCEAASGLLYLPAPSGELFAGPQLQQTRLTRLLERLQARLGPGAVQRLRPNADHRPERATRGIGADAALQAEDGGRGKARPRTVDAGDGRGGVPESASGDDGPWITRPVWLLQTPQALEQMPHGPDPGQPLLQGRPLQLLAGPERIEAGWWDEAPAVRDYFIARTESGALVWVYRARRQQACAGEREGWFLQGRFG